MGYDAFVICNCYQSGNTTDPPHKEYIVFDEEGLYLELPNKLWKKQEHKAFQMSDEFDEWLNTACNHNQMELCDEYLTNAQGMGAFRSILKRLGGKDRFPVLTEFLPTSNYGILPAELASKALKELLLFDESNIHENRVILIEKSTNELKATVNSEKYMLFVFTAGNKFNYGIDKEGFFILQNTKENDNLESAVVFRSKRFIQQYVSENCFRFTDNKTKNSFICTVGLHPYESNPKNSFEFALQEVNVKTSEEYSYITEPLVRLVNASIESGNPIHWC